jgi:PAS domain S-box-containing protein
MDEMMKLQTKLLVLYALSTILIMLVLGVVLYSKIWEQRLHSIRQDMSNELQHVDFALNAFFAEVENDVNALVASEAVRSRDDRRFTSFLEADERTHQYRIQMQEQKIINIFNNYLVTHPYVNAVYMGRENGSFVRSHKRERPTRYDPRDRPWYRLAQNNPGKVMRTDAYSSLTTPDVNIGHVRALVDGNGVFYGVVGVDVTLQKLTDYIANIQINPEGKILLLDGSGLVLAGLGKKMLFKNIHSHAPDLLNALKEAPQGFASVNIQGQPYYAFSRKAAGQDWTIAALIPSGNIEKEIVGQIVMTISGLAIGLILLSFLTLMGLKRYVLRPLNQFTDETRYIAQTSNLERRIDIRTKDEIGQLAKAYNEMLSTLGRAEADLRRSEKQYRDIFDNAVMGIFQSTPEGTYRSVNPALARIFGYRTPEELMADIRDIRSQVYAHPEDRTKVTKRFEEGEGIVKGFEVEYKRRDGSRFWMSLSGKAIRDEQGRVLYYEGTIEDISARKLAEKELAKYRDHLEELVRARTADLEIAREKAESADRLKSAFLATMSHELRTPLNSIIGFTGIILQGIVGPLNDEQKKQLSMVRGSAQHLLSLINDVLDISKIEAGQLQIAREPFDLHSVVEKTVESARPLAVKKGLDLTCTVSAEIETITGDRRRVEQILLNLISNAVKFTEKGSVKIACRPEGDAITVSVMDTGIGIKTEDLGTLFQAFRQIDSGMTRKYEGTGLGLSISKRLVELMGGQIRVASVWGEGSTFSFSLPKERKDI